MDIEVNGTRLWFDVDGLGLVPDGPSMRPRPTVVLVHGGPGAFDHSYLKPAFSHLTAYAQVVYLDLRSHGRSSWDPPEQWSFERCADDLRQFCDTVGITNPVVFGHSMGAPIVLLYGARHPEHPAGLVACSGYAHFDVDRLVDAARRIAGDEIADIARRDYSHQPITAAEAERIFAAFGPHVPDDQTLARCRMNLDLAPHGAALTDQLDIRDQLATIQVPTLACVGELDPITPVHASQEIIDSLAPGVAELEVLPDTGHFPWLDTPQLFWARLERFIATVDPHADD